MRIRQAADATDAQVTVRDWQRHWSPERNPGFYPVDDSKTWRWSRSTSSSPSARLILRRRQVPGTAPSAARSSGWWPSPSTTTGKLPRVAFYSRDFDDVRETVAFVRDRVLLATSAALLIALFGGYLVARGSRRAWAASRGPPATWLAGASWSRSP